MWMCSSRDGCLQEKHPMLRAESQRRHYFKKQHFHLKAQMTMYPRLWAWQFLTTYFWDISSDKISGDTDGCDILIYVMKYIRYFEDLLSSVNQLFPKWLNASYYKTTYRGKEQKFIDRVSNPIFHTKQLLLTKFWCNIILEQCHNDLKILCFNYVSLKFHGNLSKCWMQKQTWESSSHLIIHKLKEISEN